MGPEPSIATDARVGDAVEAHLPQGTVTFMFTDVERSTSVLAELGAERYADSLARHLDVIRAALERHGGVEVDTQGDSLFAAFSSARQAVAAADEIQRGLDGPLRVRIGLHTGEALVRDGRYVGLDVHRAARVAALAWGGQVLLTTPTAELLEPRAELRDLGLHRLRDIREAVRIFQLGGEEDGAPPPGSRAWLPVASTSFVGREDELERVEGLLRRGDARLVTLTGPGGTGKSRLALEAATRAAHRYSAGVVWVPLARLHDAQDVLPALAQALELREESGRPLREVLASRLGGAQALVVLDNCEHLLPDVAQDVAWLRDLGGPTVVVTSRERLRLDGEHVLVVPALDALDAVDLLVQRAGTCGVELERTPEVRDLCTRLDRLPLALELAAARMPLFAPRELLDRLEERLDLLRGGAEADPRQQTLRATIAWSYDLLDDEERRLLRSLSVFAGGCTYESAVAVCDADPDTLQSLIEKSLVQRGGGASGTTRFALLDTVRAFVTEELEASGEAQRVRDRHAEHLADLGDDAAVWRPQPEVVAAVSRLADEVDDLSVALEHARATGDALLRLRLASALALVCTQRFTRFSEPRAELEAALDAASSIPPVYEARALARIVEASWSLGEWDRVVEAGGRAVAILREEGNELTLSHVLALLGPALVYTGRGDEGHRLLEEAIGIERRRGHESSAASVETNLGCILVHEGDLSGARALFERLEARGAGASPPSSPASLRLVRLNRALCHVLEGEAAEAERLYADVLAGLELPVEERVACYALEGLAASWAVRAHRVAEAAALLAAAARARREVGSVAELPERALRERTAARLRTALGDEAYEEAVAAGDRMSLRRAVARALAALPSGTE